LKTVAFTCNTTVQLAEALPEFAKYLPKASAPTSNLPATDNLVKDFMAAGWPKGKGAQ
jgi:hypothetical protein